MTNATPLPEKCPPENHPDRDRWMRNHYATKLGEHQALFGLVATYGPHPPPEDAPEDAESKPDSHAEADSNA